MDSEETLLKPAVSFLKTSADGSPYLEGWRCQACQEVFLEGRRACPRCCSIASLKPEALATTGKLYNYTIVHRSFPGVITPFVSAIVDLDGGGTIKGNLIDIEPDIRCIAFDMPVEVVFRDAGRTDQAGSRYLAYFFVPKSTEGLLS